MKNLLTLLFTCLLFVFTSCEKEELAPQAPQAAAGTTSNNNSGPNHSSGPDLCQTYPYLSEENASPFVVHLWDLGTLSLAYEDNICYDGPIQNLQNVSWQIYTITPPPFYNYNTNYQSMGISLPNNANALYYNITLTATYANGGDVTFGFTLTANGNVTSSNVDVCENCTFGPCPGCGGSAIASIILPVH